MSIIIQIENKIIKNKTKKSASNEDNTVRNDGIAACIAISGTSSLSGVMHNKIQHSIHTITKNNIAINDTELSLSVSTSVVQNSSIATESIHSRFQFPNDCSNFKLFSSIITNKFNEYLITWCHTKKRKDNFSTKKKSRKKNCNKFENNKCQHTPKNKLHPLLTQTLIAHCAILL